MPDQTELYQLTAQLADEYWHEYLDGDIDIDGFVFVASERGQRHRSYTRRTVITRGPSGQHYRWAYGDVHNDDHDDLPPSQIGAVVELVWPVDKIETTTVRTWVTTPEASERADDLFDAHLDAEVKRLRAQLDRVTDLFEKWAAEENEHRTAGEFGLAEGFKVAIEELRVAVHGKESADV